MRTSFLPLFLLLAGCGSPDVDQPVATWPTCPSHPGWMLEIEGLDVFSWGGRLALDGSCNALLTGQSKVALTAGGAALLPDQASHFVMKVGADGEVVWTTALGRARPLAESVPVSVPAALPSGDVVVAGLLYGDLHANGALFLHDTGEGTPFVARLDGATGQIVWAEALPAGTQIPVDVVVEAADRIVVAGSFTGEASFAGLSVTSHGGRDAFILRLDDAGQPVSFDAVGGAKDDAVAAIAADGAGGLFLVGSTDGVEFYPCDEDPENCSPDPAEASTAWVARLAEDDTIVWQAKPKSTTKFGSAWSLALDGHGDLLTLHDPPVDTLSSHVTLSRWAPSGELLASRDLQAKAFAVRADRASNVHLVGLYTPSDPPDLGGGSLPTAYTGLSATFLATYAEGGATLENAGFLTGNLGWRPDLTVDEGGGAGC